MRENPIKIIKLKIMDITKMKTITILYIRIKKTKIVKIMKTRK